jgi:hypothetical protein
LEVLQVNALLEELEQRLTSIQRTVERATLTSTT